MNGFNVQVRIIHIEIWDKISLLISVRSSGAQPPPCGFLGHIHQNWVNQAFAFPAFSITYVLGESYESG